MHLKRRLIAWMKRRSGKKTTMTGSRNRSRIVFLVLIFTVFALLASVVTANFNHSHDDPVLIEVVNGSDGDILANDVLYWTRCTSYYNTNTYWSGSWRHVVRNGYIQYRQLPYTRERRYIYDEEHRWLGGWPRHRHAVDCPWRTYTNV
jgi:hypothetical protein